MSETAAAYKSKTPQLHISDELSLPAEAAVTRSFGILGMRGSGKSNLAVVMAEEMFRVGLHWVAIDPKGDWYGVRRQGTGPGLPVVVFGGEHGDVPLEPTATAGVLVAELILNERLTCVIDLSEFSKGGKIAFLAGNGPQEGFAGHLFRKKKREQPPIHIFLEEAHDYVPQKATGEVGKLIDVVSNLQTMGRTKGLGCSVLSQRSARVHKDVLTQVDTLLAFRTIAPQDRDSIEGWVKYHGLSDELVASLPQLKSGECWLWSPEWLETMQRIQCRRRQTFDSGATPTGQGTRRLPATVADVDLVAIKTQMHATIERAKADDPKELRKQMAELQRQLKAKPAAPAAAPKTVEVPRIKPDEIKRLEKFCGELEKYGRAYLDYGSGLTLVAKGLTEQATAIRAALIKGSVPPPAVARIQPQPRPGAPAAPRAITAIPSSAEVGTGGLRRILTALAHRSNGLSFRQIGVRARMNIRGGSFNTYISRARTAGWIEGDRSLTRITDDGVAALGTYEPPPTGRTLYEAWLHELGGSGAGRILMTLYDAGGASVPKGEVASRVGMEAGGGSFNTYISRLRSLELIEGKGELKASDELFD